MQGFRSISNGSFDDELRKKIDNTALKNEKKSCFFKKQDFLAQNKFPHPK